MNPSKVFVGNIPYTATDDDVREWFTEGGHPPSRVTLPKEKDTGKPRGFAFVEFETAQDAADARKDMDGQQMDGRRIFIDAARDKPSDNGGGRDRR